MPADVRLAMPPPNEKQRLALLENHRYVGYGGARGGGKSWFVRWKAILLALNYPGIKILITRRTYRELLNNHIAPLLGLLGSAARYSHTDKCFSFPNGSTIWFGYCACDGDMDRYQGSEYDVIFLDEATQLSEYQMRAIAACLRGVNSFPKRMYFTCNPGGQGHAYIKRVFIDRQSGKDTSRPELQRLLEFVREGDTVVVESISRFARCTKDLLELIEQLTAKGVEFISKKESLDTSTPSGRFVLTIFGAVAQLEREYLLQRQKEGIAIAKQEGKYKGRKPLERTGQDAVMASWRNGEITAVEAMRTLKMSKTTFYRRVNQMEGREQP